MTFALSSRLGRALALALMCSSCKFWGASESTKAATAPASLPQWHPTSQWQALATQEFRGKQDDISFGSPSVGYYGNGEGKLYKTVDGGEAWTEVWKQPGTFIRALGFIDEANGFLGNVGVDYFPGVTDTNLLYRTKDGGASWTAVALPDANGVKGICAIDILKGSYINHGVLAQRHVVTVGGRVGGPAAVFRSLDGGETWKRLRLPEETSMVLDVKFLDADFGFVLAADSADVEKSHGMILRTTDGGASWQIVYRSKRPFELMWKVSFPTEDFGYATLQSYNPDPNVTERFVVKTSDGGLTWQEMPLVSDASVREFGVGFIDELHGWVGAVPHAFVTDDGGRTWKPELGLGKAVNKFRIVRGTTSSDAAMFAIGPQVHRVSLQLNQP